MIHIYFVAYDCGRFPCLCSVFPVIILSMLNFLSQGLMKDVWKLQSATEGFFLLLPSTCLQYHSALTRTDSETLFLRDSTYGTLWKILQKLVTGVFIGKEIKISMDCFGEEMEFQHQTIHKNLKCQGLNAIARTNRTKTEHSALILTRSINPSISLQLVPYNNFAFYGAVNAKQKLNAFYLLSWLVWHVLKILTLIAAGSSELKHKI